MTHDEGLSDEEEESDDELAPVSERKVKNLHYTIID